MVILHWIYFLLVFLYHGHGVTATDPCHSTVYSVIDEPMRSVGNVLLDNYTKPICDRLLPGGWYKFAGGATIPTSCVQKNHCGTSSGIWMNGTLPSVGDGIVERQICALYHPGGDCCSLRSTLKVKNCGGSFVYRLRPTPGCSIAYCAGTDVPCPPNMWSPTGYQPGCIEAYPMMLQTPQLSNPIVEHNTFKFNCHLPFDPSRTDVGFEITWLFDGHIDPTVQKERISGTTRDAELDQKYIQGHLGEELSCGVRTYFTKSPTRMSPRTPSNGYWCGIKLSEARLSVGENEKAREVKLISTIPIVCNKTQQVQCKLEIYLEPNNHDVRQTTKCTQTFLPTDWNPVTHQAVTSFQVLAERDFMKDGDKNLEMNFKPIFSVDSPPVFNNFHIQNLQIRTIDKPTSTCACLGDPHCITLDRQLLQHTGNYRKKSYNYYKVGEFTMYKSTNREFEVQTRTWTCWKVTCICAVAAREGNDVITIDMCHTHFGHAYPKLSIQHKGQISQGTVIQRDPSGNTYMIYFPSGAWVKVHVRRGALMDVTIQAPEEDFEGTQGLCGTFDGRMDNDLTRRDGHVDNFSKQPDGFVESWRIPVGSSFFDKEVPVDMKLNNDMYYCNCDQKKGLVDCTIDGKAARPAIHSRCLSCTVVAKGTGQGPASTSVTTHGNGRRRRQTRTLLQDFERPVYDFDYGYMWQPTIPDFPTPSGRNRTEVEQLCNDALNNDPTVRACVAQAGMDLSTQLENCVEDIKISDDIRMVDSAIDSAIMSCSEVVLKEPSFYNNDTGLAPAFITTHLCQDRCSGNGRCVEGVCHCQPGYTGTGCEGEQFSPPDLYAIEGTDVSQGTGRCDVQKTSCDTVYVTGDNFHNVRNLLCELKEFEFDGTRFKPTGHIHNIIADYDTTSQIGCRMPRRSSANGHRLVKYNVYVTNDGSTYSRNMSVIILDSTCMACINHTEECHIKNNTCLIDGNCRRNSETNANNTSQVCYPPANNTEWTDVRNIPSTVAPSTATLSTVPPTVLTILPAAPLGGVMFVRFDIWTTSKTGCRCSFNASRTDCACCDIGGCQCPGPNQFQCAQCGHDDKCGTPLPGPNNGVDGYTLALADCQCQYDPSLYNCACCHNNGCLCTKQHKNQCADCSQLQQQCGAKPWIFGPALPIH